jgi:hypothetical protein
LYSPPPPRLTVSEVRALVDRERARKEKIRINTKLEKEIALIPDRTSVSALHRRVPMQDRGSVCCF